MSEKKVESPDVPKEQKQINMDSYHEISFSELYEGCQQTVASYADIIQTQLKEPADLRAERDKAKAETFGEMDKVDALAKYCNELKAERDKLKERLEISFSYQIEKTLNDQLGKQIKENDELKADNELLKGLPTAILKFIKEAQGGISNISWSSMAIVEEISSRLKSYLENK